MPQRSAPHYHIRWSGQKPLDWMPYASVNEAEDGARKIVRLGESFSIEEFDGDCVRCLLVPSKESLQEVLAWTIKKARADCGTMQILNQETQTLHIIVQHGFGRRFLEFFDTVHGDFAACGAALARGERVLVNDVSWDPVFRDGASREVVLGEGVRSVQSFPLITSSGQLVGIISVHYRAPDMPRIPAHHLDPQYTQDVADHLHRLTGQR